MFVKQKKLKISSVSLTHHILRSYSMVCYSFQGLTQILNPGDIKKLKVDGGARVSVG